jgi:hypothetical protein
MRKRPSEVLAWVATNCADAAFHWPVEFPEVFARGGFDSCVGNPPFLGGKRISTEYGDSYERFLKVSFDRSRGAADLCCYFFRRAFSLLRHSRHISAYSPLTSIVEGDAPSVGLSPSSGRWAGLLARTNFRWPGQAGICLCDSHFSLHFALAAVDDRPVSAINSRLRLEPVFTVRVEDTPCSYTQGQTLNAGFHWSEERKAHRGPIRATLK